MKTLHFRENHCDFCEKVFCCMNCRLKHENHVHERRKPSFIRKSLLPSRKRLSSKSSPQIQESDQSENSESAQLKNPRKRKSIEIYSEDSPFKSLNKLSICDENKSVGHEDEIFIKPVANSTSEKLEQEIFKENNPKISEEAEDDDVNKAKMSSDSIIAEDKKENISPQDIPNCNEVTFENSKSARENKSDITVSTIDLKSSLDQSASFYYADSDNITSNKSEIDQKWRTALTGFCDSSTNELKGISENSSIYYACSESLTGGSQNTNCEMKDFKTFDVESRHASTQFEVTISFVQDQDLTKTNDTSCEILSEEITVDIDNEIISIDDCTQTETCSETTMSASSGTLSLINFGEFSPIIMESDDHRPPTPKTPEIFKNFETQSHMRLREEMSGNQNENSESSVNLNELADLPVADPTFTITSDKTFWQSFSNSIQRAYNSTKQLYDNIGRKNKSKRVVDDVEEQPRPKRQKILCRPPIRENPRLVFTQDGDTRRPVIAFDKGTQTEW